MKSFTRLLILANKLVDNNFNTESETILAQILEINQIRDLQTITPEHPLYPLIKKLLRPGEGIQDKLADFSKRLRQE